MGHQKDFFSGPVDRTPTGACAVLALSLLAIFCFSAYGLWELSSFIKHQRLSLPRIPAFHLPETKNLTQDVQDAAQNAAKQQAQKAIDASATAAVQAAQEQADQLKAQASQEADQKVKGYLNQ